MKKHTLPNLVIPLSTCIFICDLYFDGYAPYVDNKNAIIVNQIHEYGLFCCIEDWYGSSSNEGNLNTAICIEKEINSNIAAIAGNINPLSEWTYWRMNVLTYERIDVWTYERIDVWTYWRMNVLTYERKNTYLSWKSQL